MRRTHRRLLITGLRAKRGFWVTLDKKRCRITPKPFELLCSLALTPGGWLNHPTDGEEADRVYHNIKALRRQLASRELIISDGAGSYRLRLRRDQIKWHVPTLQTIPYPALLACLSHALGFDTS